MKWHSANICRSCWRNKHGDSRAPAALTKGWQEKCCYCGRENEDGIYIRENAQMLQCEHQDQEKINFEPEKEV
jgi:hypothetical protein